MAFPAVQTADTQNGTQTSNSSSWTLTYPTNLVSGDLILALVAIDGQNAAPTWPADWVRNAGAESAVSCSLGTKISLGTETGAFTFQPGASEQGAWRVFRITGWFGSGLPTIQRVTIVIDVATWAGWEGMDFVYCHELSHALGFDDGAPSQEGCPTMDHFALLSVMYPLGESRRR